MHLRQRLAEAPQIHYPGNLQGRTHRESGPKGGLLVELDRRGPARVEFRSFAPVRFETVVVGGLEEADTLERLLARFRAEWEAARRADPDEPSAEWVVRFRTAGGTPSWKRLGDQEERASLARETARELGLLDVEVQPGPLHPVVRVAEPGDRALAGAHLRKQTERGAEHVRAAPVLTVEELARMDRADAGEPDAYVRALLEGADAAREAGERRPSRARAVLVLVVGLALVFVAQGAERLGLLLAGALAVGAGSVMLLEALRHAPRAPAPPPPTETGPLQATLDEAERALDGLLTGLLPLREGLTQRSPTPLAAGLERLQQAIRDRRDREAELAGLREQEAANAREGSALALTCGVQAPDDALAAAHLLASTVADMRRRQATAERTAEELSRLERQRDREADALTRMRAEEGALRERLSDLGSGDPAEGMRLFQARAQAAAGAARLRQDLIAAHPDLDELQDRIRAAEAEGEDCGPGTTTRWPGSARRYRS